MSIFLGSERRVICGEGDKFMPFEIVRADITALKVDAIVNAANRTLLGGGGVDGAIHEAAGPELLAACRALGGCEVGEAKLTKGYLLPASYVIHTVGPIWSGGEKGEEDALKACYRNSLSLALEMGFESIAFPLISSGIFAYPKDRAIQVVLGVMSEFLLHHDVMIYLVVYDRHAYLLSEKLFSSVKAFIDDYYVDEHAKDYAYSQRSEIEELPKSFSSSSPEVFKHSHLDICYENVQEESVSYPKRSSRCLEDVLSELQETFSEHLMRLIDLKGLTDVQTYKRANIDRKLFSKIRSDKFYKPSKVTVIAFAIALELSLDETRDLLLKAGFALSRSSKFDLIIEYFIREEMYDIYEINEALFDFDQALLGGA